MTYKELESRHQEENNNFKNIFFAFTEKQFSEGMGKLGLGPIDYSSIVRVGCGGYVLKSKLHEFKEMISRHKEEMKNALKNEKFLLDALIYELQNHEFDYTGDASDALNALGLKREDVSDKIFNKATAVAESACW